MQRHTMDMASCNQDILPHRWLQVIHLRRTCGVLSLWCQPLSSYTAMYPHGGAYPHSLMPMMENPLTVEPAKSSISTNRSSNKKLKEIDGTTVSTGSGSSKKIHPVGIIAGKAPVMPMI